MIAVIYDSSGRITECADAPASYFVGKSALVVASWRADWGLTHSVQAGVLTPLTATAAQALSDAKASKAAAIDVAFDAQVAAGFAYGGLHVRIDDAARGDLIGLAVVAQLVAADLATWPAGYARGWVSLEGARIPLLTPQAGIALALAAGAYHSALVQHAADLTIAAGAAADLAAVAAVDPTAPWPST